MKMQGLMTKFSKKDQVNFKKELIKRSLEILDEREIRIIKDRHLIEDTKTLDILGKELKISKERVRQIENKAIKKLQEEIKIISETKLLEKKIN